MSAEPAEKRRSAHVITLTGYFAGLPVESVLRMSLRPPHTMEFRQVRGTLRALNGQCLLAQVEDGTEVRYRLEADPGIAMITDAAARQFLVQFVERMLDRVRLAAERKPPLRRAGRPDAAAPAGLEAVEEEEADAVLEGPAAAASAPSKVEIQRVMTSPPAPVSPRPGVMERAPAPTERPEPARTGKRRRRRRRRGRPPASPGENAAPPR